MLIVLQVNYWYKKVTAIKSLKFYKSYFGFLV